MWTKDNRGRYDRSRLRYPTGLSDIEWALVASLIPPAKRGGYKRTVDVREIVKGIMYILGAGRGVGGAASRDDGWRFAYPSYPGYGAWVNAGWRGRRFGYSGGRGAAMSHAIALPPPMTVAGFEAFLAAQRDDTRWELVDGQILAMTNPSLNHAEIVGNVSAALRPVMPADRRCRVAVGGVRVQVSDDTLGVYAPRPDVMVWCGPMDGTRNFVTMPLVIVEVLSPSNMDTDRGAKLRFYKAGLPTLRHIALVYQDQMRVENYRRTDAGWELDVLTRPGDAPRFGALLFEMPLADVYAGVALPAG